MRNPALIMSQTNGKALLPDVTCFIHFCAVFLAFRLNDFPKPFAIDLGGSREPAGLPSGDDASLARKDHVPPSALYDCLCLRRLESASPRASHSYLRG